MARTFQLATAEQRIDSLLKALAPFAALLQPHVEHRAHKGDATPVFGIDDAVITVGDLRLARDLIKEGKKWPRS